MQIYIADHGDTLSKIAAKYRIGLDEFISINPHISSPDRMISGMHVYIPNVQQTKTLMLPPPCPPEPPRNFLDQWIPLVSLERMAQTDYDVLIIGTGAGGGALLWRLCQQWEKSGKRIGIIDAGNLLLPTNVHNIGTMQVRWEDYFLNPKISRPIGAFLPEFRGAREVWALGGRTLFWWAVCARTYLPGMKGWPVPSNEMELYYNIAEQMMNVAPFKSPLTQALLTRLWEGGFPLAEGTPFAARNELGHGEINRVKYFSSIDFIALAQLRHSFDLAVNARAVQIVTENGRAAGVKVMTPEKKGYFLRAKTVVLAASTYQTPRLLLYSGIQGRAIGHYLTDQSYITAKAVIKTKGLPDNLDAFDIIVPETENQPYQFTFVKQDATLDEIRIHFNGFGTVEPRYENRVYLDPYRKDDYGIPEIQVNYSYSDKDLAVIAQMTDALKKVVSAMGGTLISVENKPEICLMQSGESAHASVTCRMGDDPNTSVTNRDGQVHNVPGLYVADNSAMPSLGASDITLTTVALAIRTADRIVDRFK